MSNDFNILGTCPVDSVVIKTVTWQIILGQVENIFKVTVDCQVTVTSPLGWINSVYPTRPEQVHSWVKGG